MNRRNADDGDNEGEPGSEPPVPGDELPQDQPTHPLHHGERCGQ
jgi:hypothetical protein